MKNYTIILVIALFFGTIFSAVAQGDKRSKEQARNLAWTLELNESSLIKVTQLFDQKFVEVDQITAQYSKNPAVKQTKLAEIDAKYNMQIEALLTQTQKVAFQEYLSESNSNVALAK